MARERKAPDGVSLRARGARRRAGLDRVGRAAARGRGPRGRPSAIARPTRISTRASSGSSPTMRRTATDAAEATDDGEEAHEDDQAPRRPEDGRGDGGRRRRWGRGAGAAQTLDPDAVHGARRRSSRSPAPISCFRCGASTASAATTRRMRARWARTRLASRRSSSRSRPTPIQLAPPGETIDHPYPTLTKNYHYEVELVAALGRGRARRSGRAGARSGARLHRRARHDPARPPARDGRREEALGDRQELRPFGGARSAAAGGEDRPFHAGRDLAQGQRADQAERQSEPDDLERRRADEQPLEGVRAHAGRHHLFGHAGERRPGRARATSWTRTSTGCRTSASGWSDRGPR